HAERAARLCGAAEALRERAERSVSPQDSTEHGQLRAALRRTLGDDELESAWVAGRSLSVDQAIDYALTAPPVARVPVPKAHQATPRLSSHEQQAWPLSVRELEVATLVARGRSNRQIAETLVIAERTASTHVGHILQKLGVSSRSQIATWVAERGLL